MDGLRKFRTGVGRGRGSRWEDPRARARNLSITYRFVNRLRGLPAAAPRARAPRSPPRRAAHPPRAAAARAACAPASGGKCRVTPPRPRGSVCPARVRRPTAALRPTTASKTKPPPPPPPPPPSSPLAPPPLAPPPPNNNNHHHNHNHCSNNQIQHSALRSGWARPPWTCTARTPCAWPPARPPRPSRPPQPPPLAPPRRAARPQRSRALHGVSQPAHNAQRAGPRGGVRRRAKGRDARRCGRGARLRREGLRLLL